MRNVFTIDADLKKKMYISEPTVTQNDDITFIVNVLDNGAPFSLTGVTTASLANTRIDGKTVVTPGTIIDGNTIQFDLGTNETAVPGRVLATVQLYDEDERVSTIAFTYRVVKDPTGSGYVPSDREQTLIEVVLNNGPLVIQQAQDAAEYATAQGDYAKQVADENKTRWLNPVATFADIATTYPNPQHGDTVMVTDDGENSGSVYRYENGQWNLTQKHNDLAIADVQNKIGILSTDFVVSVKDSLRQAVESATGGKNTVMYDDLGNPSIMVCIPRFNLSDVIDGAPNTPHPAFIVDGVVKNEIWISKFQNIVHDNRAYSLPGQDPRTSVNYDQAKQYCANKGSGWHLMTNAEWAAIALWSKKNGTMPRGNNNYGKDHLAPHERGKLTYKYTIGGTEYEGRVATGSGPASWSHDGTNAGIFDLNGNVWEWVDGIRIEDGKIYVHKDNDFDTPTDDLAQWIDTGVFFDVENGNLVLNNSRTTVMNEATQESKSRTFETLTGAAGFTIPDLLKHLAIAPIDASYGGDAVYNRNYGSRFVYRGGHWLNGSFSGIFALNSLNPRSNSDHNLGFRSAYISPN